MAEKNLQLHFKEFVKTDPLPKGIDKIKSAYSKTSDHVCDLFVYKPKNIEEAQIGTLFMLGKIENIPKNKYRNFDFLLNLLISVIKREFYSSPKRPASKALESSLNKANLYLADFAKKGNVEWISNLDFICGAFSKNTLHITCTGTPIIKLFRETAISHIETKFPPQKNFYPLKTFNDIASGTILSGDRILLGTKNILDIINLANLKELSKNNSSQMIENIKILAENKANKAPILCLILEAKIDMPEKVTANLPQSDKMDELNPLTQKISKTHVTSQVKKTFHKLIVFIAPISRQNKPAFFVVILLTILFLILPFSAVQKINYSIQKNNFNKLSAEIQEVQNKTDITLIYQDKEKAKGLLQKNQVLLAGLLNYIKKSTIKNDDEILNKTIILQKKLQEQQDSVNNVIRIKKLEEILDFSASGFIVNPVGISKIKDDLYFYEFDSGILYKFPAYSPPQLNETNQLAKGEDANKKDLTLIFISAKDELRKMVPLENGLIVLFGQSGKIYLYDSNTNDHNSYLLDPPISVEKIKDVKNFFSNFYILDIEQNNIIKYSLSSKKENTIKGNNWLAEPIEELKETQGMAIDGSIYILKSDGIINKYFRGEKVGEIRPLLESPLAKENKIFAGIDFKNLYISDPKNKRLIVLNKEGEVINQYVNDEFIRLQDFWVTKDEKEIYLLCEKKVFKIEL